jgi:hypothetical protein
MISALANSEPESYSTGPEADAEAKEGASLMLTPSAVDPVSKAVA